MAKSLELVRKNVMLEEEKVRKLARKLKTKSESKAIRAAIDDFLFSDEVMEHLRGLRRRGTVRDAYRRTKGNTSRR